MASDLPCGAVGKEATVILNGAKRSEESAILNQILRSPEKRLPSE